MPIRRRIAPRRRGRAQGLSLLSTLMGLALGLWLMGTALVMWVSIWPVKKQQLELEAEREWRWWWAFTERQLGLAGYRQAPGVSAEHDRLEVSGAPGATVLQYRSDRLDDPTPSTRSALRLWAQGLQFRAHERSGYQLLHDTAHWWVSGFEAKPLPSAPCEELWRLRLKLHTPSRPDGLWRERTVLRRNPGGAPCRP